jgi:hypothetical protein
VAEAAAEAGGVRARIHNGSYNGPHIFTGEGEGIMKKLQRKTLGLALVALLAFGGVNASAKQMDAARRQVLNGVVVSIDMGARTIQVREQGTGRTLSVRVPEGKSLRTNLATSPSLPIERLLPGMVIRDIVVQ